MHIANPTKAFILLVALICVTVLLAVGRIANEAGLSLISAIVFYAIGNSIGHTTPPFNRKPKTDAQG